MSLSLIINYKCCGAKLITTTYFKYSKTLKSIQKALSKHSKNYMLYI